MSTVFDHAVIGPLMNGVLMTPEEFDAAEDWDENHCYELINGVLIVVPAPGVGERGPNDELGFLLRTYRSQAGSTLDYTISEHTIQTKKNRRRADRVIWAGLGRTPNVDRDSPTIVVEFVSEGRRSRQRDYEAKRQEYIEIGIAEYWIIDRFRRTMTVVRREKGNAVDVVLQEDETYATDLLPGFDLRLGSLFEEADTLERARNEGKDVDSP